MTETRLPISQVVQRTGVPASTLRFYEAEGLIHADRTAGGHRQYHPAELRRIAFIRVAQRLGLTLEEIRAALETLPDDRAPNKADWARLSRAWAPRLEEQIATLARLRDQLTSCIGCGCLSLRACALYNPGDQAAELGPGPRYLLGDPVAPGPGAPGDAPPVVR